MKPEKCTLFLTQNDEISAIKDELFCSLCKKIVNHSSGRLHILGKKHLMLKFVSHLSVDTLIIPKAKHTQINKKNIDLTNVDILLIIEKKEINGKKLFYISIGKTIDPINYIACKINDNISIELVNNTLQELHLKKENFILLIISNDIQINFKLKYPKLYVIKCFPRQIFNTAKLLNKLIMSKRGAIQHISHETVDFDNGEILPIENGLHKASKDVLSTRKIFKLKRRSQNIPKPAIKGGLNFLSTEEEQTVKVNNKFAGFTSELDNSCVKSPFTFNVNNEKISDIFKVNKNAVNENGFNDTPPFFKRRKNPFDDSIFGKPDTPSHQSSLDTPEFKQKKIDDTTFNKSEKSLFDESSNLLKSNVDSQSDVVDEKIGKIESRVNKDVTSIATEYLGKDLKKEEVNTLFKPFNNVNDKNFSKINKITTTDKCSIFMSTPKVVSIKHQNSSSSISPIYTNKMSDGITINTVTKTDSCESVVDDKNTYLDSPQVSKDSEYIKRQENVRRYIRTEEEVNLIYDKNNTNKKLCFKMAKLNSALFRWFHRKIVKNPSLDFSNSFRDYIGYVQNIIKENANTESASIEFSKDEGRQTLESVESICKNVVTEETSKHVQKEETKKEDVSKFLEAIIQDDIEITEEGSVFKEKCTFFFNDKKWENRGACVCFLKNEPEKQLIIRNYTSIASIILNVRINSLKNVKKEEKNKISFTTVSNPPLDQKQPNRPHLILLKFKTPQAVDDFLVKINN